MTAFRRPGFTDCVNSLTPYVREIKMRYGPESCVQQSVLMSGALTRLGYDAVSSPVAVLILPESVAAGPRRQSQSTYAVAVSQLHPSDTSATIGYPWRAARSGFRATGAQRTSRRSSATGRSSIRRWSR